MKIVRLVLLLSLVGVPAACTGATVTEPETTAASALPSFGGAATDTTTTPTTARDGGGSYGSGT